MKHEETYEITLNLTVNEYVALRVACRSLILKLEDLGFAHENPPCASIKNICGAYGELARAGKGV